MSWTTPRTWDRGVVSAPALNQEFHNLQWLYDRPLLVAGRRRTLPIRMVDNDVFATVYDVALPAGTWAIWGEISYQGAPALDGDRLVSQLYSEEGAETVAEILHAGRGPNPGFGDAALHCVFTCTTDAIVLLQAKDRDAQAYAQDAALFAFRVAA